MRHSVSFIAESPESVDELFNVGSVCRMPRLFEYLDRNRTQQSDVIALDYRGEMIFVQFYFFSQIVSDRVLNLRELKYKAADSPVSLFGRDLPLRIWQSSNASLPRQLWARTVTYSARPNDYRQPPIRLGLDGQMFRS